ncbi:MAG: hypothetical protein ABIH59_01705 [archaeon]
MGFFSRKKKNEAPTLSKLPEASSIPVPQNIPQNTLQQTPPPQPQQNFSLPTFPPSNLGNSINQNVIKEEITRGNAKNHSREASSIPPLPLTNHPQTLELEQIHSRHQRQEIESPIPHPPHHKIPKTLEIAGQPKTPRTLEAVDFEPPKEHKGGKTSSRTMKAEPLFIQLDKFEETISAFDEIKLKISEIESLLRSVREVKRKEEEKLNHWEEEIDKIKVQLGKIDQELFNKI